MGYIQPFDRNQLTLPESLDSYISCDNPVRLIDVFVDQFIKLHPDFSSYKGNSPTGRSAYSFGTLLKLYVYGYLNSVSSSRKLERETLRNMELIWLLGNLHPDHKTIADFRSKQTSGIHECCLDFRRFLVSSGYISGKLVAVDGSKIKANTNRDGLTLDGINRQLALLDTRLEKYLHQLNENDLVETAQEQLSELSDELGVESSLLEKIARLSQQVEELQAEKQRMLDEGSQRSFPSDREARLMKTRNGFLPAYNVQSVVDSQHHLIGAMQVTDHPNDFEDLQPSIHAMQEDLQVEVAQAVADTGYANEEQILALEEEGKVIAVPFNEGEEFTGNDIVVKNNTMSKDYNFRTGVSCKNNLGQEAELTGVVIKKVNIETEEEDVLTEQQAIEEKYDFDKYTYVAEYAFNVPGEGEVIKKAAIVRGAEE